MTILPLIERELRVRARTAATYWTRFGVVLAGVLICLAGFSLRAISVAQADIGRSVFAGLISAAFILSSASCLWTADAIGAERREGTLGLLFLTRVRNLDVLLGKFASTGMTCLLALVAFLPILAVPILAGGVTGGEAFRKGLALIDQLFLALAAGLWASARNSEKLKAARNSVLLVCGLVLIPLLQGQIMRAAGGWTDLELVSPLTTLFQAADVAYKLSAARYWISLAVVAATGLGLLFGALMAMRRRFQNDGAEDRTTVSTIGSGGRLRLRLAEDGLPPRPSTSRWLKYKPSPIHWVLRRQRGSGAVIWSGVAAGIFLSLFAPLFLRFISLSSSTSYIVSGLVQAISLTTGVIQGALFAWAASRFFVESRRSGELELLLTTPQGAQQLVSAQWDELKRLFRWPVLVLLAMNLLQLILILFQLHGTASGWRFQYTVSMLFGALHTLLSIYALCWVALWIGMRAASQARAILWTVLLVRGLPYVFGLVISLLTIASTGGSPGAVYWINLVLRQSLFIWFYLWLARLARRRLQLQLRSTDLTPFDPQRFLTEKWHRAVSAFRAARHWTPALEARNPKTEGRRKSE